MTRDGSRGPSPGEPDASGDVNLEYYGTWSPGREDYWNKMAAPRSRVATLLRLLGEQPPTSLVDLGCGNGQLLAEIGSRLPGIGLAGIDMSPAQIELNRRRLPDVDWRTMDLSTRGCVSREMHGRFDVVVASEVIEHVQDPEAFLENAFRLAVSGGGRLLLSTQSGVVRETERRVGHLRHFDPAEMEVLLRRSGWTPVRIWSCGFPFHNLSKWWANRHPSASMSRFGGDRYGPYQNLVCSLLRLAYRLNSTRRGAQLFAVAVRKPGPTIEGRP